MRILLLYIFAVLLFFSCKNESKSMNMEESIFLEESYVPSNDETSSEVLKYEKLSKLKFTNYIDLLRLKGKHPEFIEDIEVQIHQLSKDSIVAMYNHDDFSVENIHQEGGIKQVSDSLKKIKLVYEIVSKSNKITDSVFANIFTKTIIVDNKTITSNKVIFSK